MDKILIIIFGIGCAISIILLHYVIAGINIDKSILILSALLFIACGALKICEQTTNLFKFIVSGIIIFIAYAAMYIKLSPHIKIKGVDNVGAFSIFIFFFFYRLIIFIVKLNS